MLSKDIGSAKPGTISDNTSTAAAATGTSTSLTQQEEAELQLPTRASYQRSPRVSHLSVSNGGNHSAERESIALSFPFGLQQRMANGFRRVFAMKGQEAKYENPPVLQEQDDAFDDEMDSSEHDNSSKNSNSNSNNCNAARYRQHMKSHAGANFHFRAFVSVLFLALVIASIKFWLDSQHRLSDYTPIYYGEEPVCDQEETLMQRAQATSTIRNAEHGAVASDHPTCSRVGLSMLQEPHNGNAVDAAVATALCLGVANPSSSGIGGGAFMLIHAEASHKEVENMPEFHDARNNGYYDDTDAVHKNGNVVKENNGKITEVIDCREVAGEAATTMMYETEGVADDASLFGGLAVGVPGELRGLELAHARHGRLDWKTVVQPAMELARDGIPVYPHLAHDIASIALKADDDGHDGLPLLRSLLTHNDDWKRPLKEGQLIRNTKLAETLEAIMQEGADAIYTGTRGQQLADDIQRAGGILTKKDLEQYRPTLRNPLISDNVFGFHIVGCPPPSSGGAVIMGALRFLAGYASPLASFADTLTVHRMVEALRHVFAIRMSMGDPDFPIPNEVTNATTMDAVNDLTRGPYMEQLRLATSDDGMLNLSHYGGKKFAQLHDTDGQGDVKDAKEGDRRRRLASADGGSLRYKTSRRRRLADPFGYLNDDGTSHFSVVDKDGNSVAMTTSVNSRFGSCVVSESTGILLNNQMDDFGNPGSADYFGLKPSAANFIKPGKKPLSSMSPTMIFQTRQGDDENSLGDLRMVVGGSGGPKIISAVFQVIVNHLLLGKPLFESVAHPRVHNQLIYHGAAATNTENSMSIPGVNLEVSNRTKTALEKRGNRLVDINYAGTVQAVSIDMETGKLNAVSDIRKGGLPAGY